MTTTTFNTAIDERDKFLGQRRCIVCGAANPLMYCHIIRDPEPQFGRALTRHEPRNGILLCNYHHDLFDGKAFFIRFLPDIQKFIFINYSKVPALQQFHGKAIGLDIMDRHTPLPSLFFLHEMRVRGFHPFEPIESAIPDDTLWQNWILSDSVFDNATGSFRRDSPLDNRDNGSNSFSESAQSRPQFQPTTMSTGDISSGERRIALNEEVIAEILAATRAMPSWKACEVDGTSFTGTAQESIEKYPGESGIDLTLYSGGSRKPNVNHV